MDKCGRGDVIWRVEDPFVNAIAFTHRKHFSAVRRHHKPFAPVVSNAVNL